MSVVLRRAHVWLLAVLFAGLVACEKAYVPPPPMLDVAPLPANPSLSQTARDLLVRISQYYGKATLAGQVEYQEEGQYVALDYIATTAERRPVIVGLDMMEFSASRFPFAPAPEGLMDDAIRLAKQEGMVLTLSWHWNAPMHLINDEREPWWRGFYTSATEFNLRRALRDPKSAEYQALLRDIDTVALQLKRLAEADIPVLWRPLHAAEGGWFWWGAKGPEAFKELWRLMFVRMTDQHGLDNLIWVLTSEEEEWYPGDDVVDIIGIDAYPSDRTSLLRETWESLLTRHNGRKMIALTEFGGVPLIEDMQRGGIRFAYFVSWTDQNRGKLGPKSVPAAHLRRVYQSPAVITLDEWHDLRTEAAAGGVAPAEAPVFPPDETGQPLEDLQKP